MFLNHPFSACARQFADLTPPISTHSLYFKSKIDLYYSLVEPVPNEAMNTWTEEAIMSFGEFLNVLEKEKDVIGYIFISGKPDNFFADANLKMIEQMNDPASVKKGLAYRNVRSVFSPALEEASVCPGLLDTAP